ncbi:sugar-binding domain-containing protein [Alteromonas macleodii]|uniref:sugar-binding domain-containing protein n=1 Tax=Alteromonas macleodii TaxID=28108 RepID=UPI0031409FB9
MKTTNINVNNTRLNVLHIISWIFNEEGAQISCDINERVTSFKLKATPEKPIVGVAAGDNKLHAIRGALRSKLLNGLITTERTASVLLTS